MDAIVTARVPVEVKRQGNSILQELGVSTTRLINAAYEYLIATRQLPSAAPSIGEQPRSFSAEELSAIADFVGATTCSASAEFWDENSDELYHNLIAEGRTQDYEALA